MVFTFFLSSFLQCAIKAAVERTNARTHDKRLLANIGGGNRSSIPLANCGRCYNTTRSNREEQNTRHKFRSWIPIRSALRARFVALRIVTYATMDFPRNPKVYLQVSSIGGEEIGVLSPRSSLSFRPFFAEIVQILLEVLCYLFINIRKLTIFVFFATISNPSRWEISERERGRRGGNK